MDKLTLTQKVRKFEEYLIGKKICPECFTELTPLSQWDGPDDFEETGVECENCEFRFDY
jgi:hypothetical protein